ncbi:MAG: DoxX family membrane protein [Phototrophicales bacterium]|nr:DoxX family membrane protein [Phototrophicales bacterium]
MVSFIQRNQNRVVQDPKFVTALFTDVRFSVIWLAARIWLGLQWIESASGKLSNPAWMDTGEALKGYWVRAVAIPETGRPPISFDWYRDFLNGMIESNAHTWFSKLVVFGELFIGIALIIGAFVGIAAFFGAVMNFNFMLAGSASTNPVLFLIALLLIFAWKTAGFIGLDYFLLNWLGTPWGRDKAVKTAIDAEGNRVPAPVPSDD